MFASAVVGHSVQPHHHLSGRKCHSAPASRQAQKVFSQITLSVHLMSTQPRKTVLIFGIGKLGGPLTDVLSMRYPQHLFVLVSRDKERSQKRANLSRYLALQWGLTPEVLGEEVNLHNIAHTAELIDNYQPDVVFNATTPFPWWKIDSLPEREKMLANSAGPGIW